MEKFLVVEIQKNGNQIANIVTAHDSLLDAQAKFHTVALAATASNVDKHSVTILNENGYSIESATFQHRIPEYEED